MGMLLSWKIGDWSGEVKQTRLYWREKTFKFYSINETKY